MKIEFGNLIRRLSFLGLLTNIKIGWINPCCTAAWDGVYTKFCICKTLYLFNREFRFKY